MTWKRGAHGFRAGVVKGWAEGTDVWQVESPAKAGVWCKIER